MKIDHFPGMGVERPDQGEIRPKPQENQFDQILQETIEKVPADAKAAPTTTLSSEMPVVAASAALRVEKGQIALRMEKLLDLLEDYQSALGNPAIPTRDLHPLVAKLEVEREQLVPLMERIPESDEIRGLLNDLLITSTVEAMKFFRGDYI